MEAINFIPWLIAAMCIALAFWQGIRASNYRDQVESARRREESAKQRADFLSSVRDQLIRQREEHRKAEDEYFNKIRNGKDTL